MKEGDVVLICPDAWNPDRDGWVEAGEFGIITSVGEGRSVYGRQPGFTYDVLNGSKLWECTPRHNLVDISDVEYAMQYINDQEVDICKEAG